MLMFIQQPEVLLAETNCLSTLRPEMSIVHRGKTRRRVEVFE